VTGPGRLSLLRARRLQLLATVAAVTIALAACGLSTAPVGGAQALPWYHGMAPRRILAAALDGSDRTGGFRVVYRERASQWVPRKSGTSWLRRSTMEAAGNYRTTTNACWLNNRWLSNSNGCPSAAAPAVSIATTSWQTGTGKRRSSHIVAKPGYTFFAARFSFYLHDRWVCGARSPSGNFAYETMRLSMATGEPEFGLEFSLLEFLQMGAHDPLPMLPGASIPGFYQSARGAKDLRVSLRLVSSAPSRPLVVSLSERGGPKAELVDTAEYGISRTAPRLLWVKLREIARLSAKGGKFGGSDTMWLHFSRYGERIQIHPLEKCSKP